MNLRKAIMALDALQKIFDKKDIKDGIDEPNWTPRGVRYRKGSIPATILLSESFGINLLLKS